MARILPMLSRARAFYSQGVLLTFPARSRSGVRSDDGVVVFAMPANAVRVHDWGCVCPLWVPADGVDEGTLNRAVNEEVLEHCGLAVRHGGAEGFLVYGDASLAHASEILALRVVKLGKEYWAKWGAAARAETHGAQACGVSGRPQ